MATVIADISISLDGYVTGPEPDAGQDAGQGLGRDADVLHAWAFSDDPVDRAELDRAAAAGAVVMGRTLFDVVDGPDGWSGGLGYGASRDARPPFLVVTSTRPALVRLAGSHDFTFVLDGPAAAVERAGAVAADGPVVVMGGAAVIRGCLDAGVVDRLRLHLAPVVLGGGTPLFGAGRVRLARAEARVSSTATHLTYDVARRGVPTMRR
ncbi:dihydrofolate reductase [Nocardioides dongxiaopingii]|uniref:dihydrofolate reductase family protein n=1 Tax=Nocardioides sp. S-1144 TaxID=2582905 RepID=UPI0011654D1A|nr:dihydrofolate reductase family protein [Nocardioides sp. S-1144]QDH11063.1 dihydrofolate reductase [Nocardioides sp. S-1144]